MSHEFIQISFDTEKDPENKEYVTCTFFTREANVSGSHHALVIPKSQDGVQYNKMLVECCVNILFDCAQSLSKSIDYTRVTPDEYAQAITTTEPLKDFYSKRKTQHSLDIEMTHQIRGIAAMLQWMVNSTSWRNGEYHAFDAVEITQRLEALKVHSHI